MPKVTILSCRRAVHIAGRRIIPQLHIETADQCRALHPAPSHSFVSHTRHFLKPAFYSTQTIIHNHAKPQRTSAAKSHNGSASPTTAPAGALSIVFTDIVKSTAMWESKPEAMLKAMQIHDEIIRSLAQTFVGYEVKQNGDGFMISFQTALSALQFCLAVQQCLLDQDWPEELLRLRPAREVCDDDDDDDDDAAATPLFRGFRLRMSAHWGEPVCKWNKVINRMDYLGPAVNRAARFIQVAEGGQIVVSEEFLREIRKAKDQHGGRDSAEASNGKHTVVDLDSLTDSDAQQAIGDSRFEVRLLGKHQFKGLDELQKLYFIVPRSLHGRVDFWPKHKYVPGSKGNIMGENE